jgi:hypothetical protein
MKERKKKKQRRGLLCGPAGRTIHSPVFRRDTRPARLAQTFQFHLGTARTAVRSVFPFCSSSASVAGAGAKRGSLRPSLRPSVPTGPRLVSSVAGKEALTIFFLGLTACLLFGVEISSVSRDYLFSTLVCPRIQIFLARGRCASAPPIQSPSGSMDLLRLIDAWWTDKYW